MDAVVYTLDDGEFSLLKAILAEEGFTVARDPLDGHGHYEYGYQLVVVAVEGARGMEIARTWSRRYRHSQIIWITSDPYFAGIAIEYQFHDFIERPYDEERFHRSVHRVKPKCTDRKSWSF